jgi:hypothetical protein
MKNEKIIDMEQRDGVFVPATRVLSSRGVEQRSTQRYLRSRSEPQQIGKILEGIVVDFFKAIRRDMKL